MVIDPEAQDRVRVTVIATGFGIPAEDGIEITKSGMLAGNRMGVRSPLSASAEVSKTPLLRTAKDNTSADVIRLKKMPVLSSAEDEEKYEIPTFLRKQAD
jgi:hypothetical protein